MPFRDNIHDREFDKFFEIGGETAVRVGATGSVISGIPFDAIGVTYPTSTTEVFEYYVGGLAGDLQATVVVTYLTSDKIDISSVVRT